MLLNDVNVLIAAYRSEDPLHERARTLLKQLIDGESPFAWCSFAAAGFVRITTHPKVFPVPSPTAEAIEFCRALKEASASVQVEPGGRFISLLGSFLAENDIRGDHTSDAYLAALAMENGCTIVTEDKRFRKMKGVRTVSIEEALASLGLSEN